MATIPLAIADPLDQQQKALGIAAGQQGLKSLLQQQQLQQQQIQQNQLNLNDQKAMSDAMRAWDGKQDLRDYLPGALIHSGASAGAVLSINQHFQDFAKSQADTALALGQSGKVNLENEAQRHQNIADAMNNAVITNKDGSLNTAATSQALESLGHNAEFIGNLQPSEAAQLPGLVTHFKGVLANDPEDFQDQWGTIAKEHLALSQQHQMALDQLDERTKQLANTKTQQETTNTAADIGARNQWISQNTTPGQPPPTAADYETFKAQSLAKAQEAGKLQADQNGMGGGGTQTQPAATQPLADAQYRQLVYKQRMGIPLTPAEQATKSAYEAQKTVEPAFTYQMESGQGPLAPLTPQQRATAQAITEGRMDAPEGYALRSPYWQAVMGEVYRQDPQFSKQRADLRSDLTTGRDAPTVDAINTALQHSGALGDAVDALNNNDVVALNRVGNAIGINLAGKTPAAAFKLIVGRLGPETAEAYGAATGGERKDFESDFSLDLPPQTLKNNLATSIGLLNGKINSLRNKWDQNKSDSMPSFDDRFITPQAKAVLQKWQPQANGGNGGGAAGSNAMRTAARVGDVRSIKGKQMTITKVYPDGSFDAK